MKNTTPYLKKTLTLLRLAPLKIKIFLAPPAPPYLLILKKSPDPPFSKQV